MVRKGSSAKKAKQATSNKNKGSKQEGFILVDPARVRFQHSRIRPLFSGCGRSVEGTLESIRRKELAPSDLPPIQVIVGPETADGPWYFSLNNRRLWVLKRCREEGLLEESGNKVKVRVRDPKSVAEAARYSLENCAVEAKLVEESANKQQQKSKAGDEATDIPAKKQSFENGLYQSSDSGSESTEKNKVIDDNIESDDDTDSIEEVTNVSNRFHALLS